MTQTKATQGRVSRRSPRAAHTIGMSALARECEKINAPSRWHAVRDIVCRHLEISVSTTHDLKRIIKSGRCAEVVGRIAKCAREHQSPRNYRVLGGIFLLLRELTLDSVLAKEIYRQNLDDIILRVFDPDSGLHCLIAPAVHILVHLSETSPNVKVSRRLAVKGTPLTVRVLSKYTGDADTHYMLLTLLSYYVGALSGQLQSQLTPPTPKEMKALELYRAARTLTDLLGNRNPARPLEDRSLRVISHTLMWLAFYQKEAIIQLPCFTGIRTFVALILGPSVSIRCKGFLGLLNTYSSNREGDIRLCDPYFSMRVRGLPPIEEHVRIVRAESGENPDGFALDQLLQAYLKLSEERESTPLSFDPYEAGLRMVELEVNGPENELESLAYPTQRIFGTSTPTGVMFSEMERALRDQQRDYEADVLRLAAIIFAHRHGAVPDLELTLHLSERLEAANGAKKWPNHAYFYYGLIRYRSGSRYLEWGEQGLQCADCTPYLAAQIRFQMAQNKLSMAVTHLAIEPEKSEWWNTGVRYLKQMPSSISDALKYAGNGTAEGKVLQLLAAATSLLTQIQTMDDGEFDSSIAEAAKALSSQGALDYGEIAAAMSDFVTHRKIVSRSWAPLFEVMRNMDNISTEKQDFAQAWDDDEVLEDAELEKSMSKEKKYRVYEDDQPVLPQCSWCHKATMGLKKCSACEKVKYCGTGCQRLHWRHGHKPECISPEISV
ncbi:hypothetical protein SISSUDRAFT_1062468 [Sistotremastrum suecicum HHB10207 ss-3]|uniref:MYND-type domain-containing protein n=1 Tax=Sistotremastrum suecicum HHB10207 ss-3 TaxID=1314776 RepID=A0A166CWK7_9AGAM|nr:hypothetical protein SISSUDRAFT_1062468 [Sistotremastrum suecicum HHB10207 ss-3]